jgi:hypothetical protein
MTAFQTRMPSSGRFSAETGGPPNFASPGGNLMAPSGSSTETFLNRDQIRRSKPTQNRMLPDGLPAVIPPRSVFRLVHCDDRTPAWKSQVGRVFRIGYYSRQDGLDCLWLVDEQGKYEQTTDRKFLLRYFDPVRLNRETDLFGDNRPRLRAIRSPREPNGKRRRRRSA